MRAIPLGTWMHFGEVLKVDPLFLPRILTRGLYGMCVESQRQRHSPSPQKYISAIAAPQLFLIFSNFSGRAASLLIARAARYLILDRKPHLEIIKSCAVDIQHLDEGRAIRNCGRGQASLELTCYRQNRNFGIPRTDR